MVLIHQSVLRHLKHLVTDHERETCGNIRVQDDGYIELTNVRTGYRETFRTGGREACTYARYTPFIFHCHPRTSYACPSVEDIHKVAKNRTIHNSVVACIWGVWQIVKIDDNTFGDIDDLYPIQSVINSLIDKTRSRSGRRYSRALSATVMREILHHLQLLNHILQRHNVRIYFDVWQEGMHLRLQ